MNAAGWLMMLLMAGACETLFTQSLVKALLGLPSSFCPIGALAVGLVVVHFIALSTLLLLSLAILKVPLGLTWRMIAGAAAGSVAGALIVSWIASAIIVSSGAQALLSAGRIWDATQWSKACGAGVGALLGATMLGRRRTTGCS